MTFDAGGRAEEDELTVTDLTVLAIQDTPIAALVTRLAEQQDAGRHLPLGNPDRGQPVLFGANSASRMLGALAARMARAPRRTRRFRSP